MKKVLFLSITVTVVCSIWLLAQTPIGVDLLIQGGSVIDGSVIAVRISSASIQSERRTRVAVCGVGIVGATRALSLTAAL